jgi:hypothetical protein
MLSKARRQAAEFTPTLRRGRLQDPVKGIQYFLPLDASE